MATLQAIIQKEVNPFDSVTFTTGNFWTDDRATVATVESIHQSAITQVQHTLQKVKRDNHTRSILLTGDSGCGKSYLLSRLKKELNPRAFFVYIEPCPSNDYIWRHTLRYTVDSLMHVPEGESESQLLLWLKNLAAYRDGGIKKRLLGARKHFIHELRSIYPASIYQPNDFFAVLFALANQDLYLSACDWLRGNNLSEDELKSLGVGSIIDSEEAAKGIIANFGHISADNKPIVLCFDQVELSNRSADGSRDLSWVFTVNTAFHNNNLKNFVVIISIVRDIWMNYQRTIPLSDLARINNQKIILKQIDLKQVKALWASRLSPLHSQANPQPSSSIAPINERELADKYPGGKANLRSSLNFAGMLYGQYKSTSPVPTQDLSAAFQLLWQDRLNQTKSKINRWRQLSSPELIEMLISAMKVLGAKDIESNSLLGTYSICSFSYRSPEQSRSVIVWDENSNLRSFCNFMKACRKYIKEDRNINLTMIRSEFIGNSNNKGHQIYQQIFNNSSHYHIESSLESVHYLKTYQKLVNDAISGDLVLNFQPLKLADLEKVVRQTKVLHQCSLLQDLKIVPSTTTSPQPKEQHTEEVKVFLLNLVQHHCLLGKQTLVKQAQTQFADVIETKLEHLIKELIREGKMSIVNPNNKPQEQLICWIP